MYTYAHAYKYTYILLFVLRWSIDTCIISQVYHERRTAQRVFGKRMSTNTTESNLHLIIQGMRSSPRANECRGSLDAWVMWFMCCLVFADMEFMNHIKTNRGLPLLHGTDTFKERLDSDVVSALPLSLRNGPRTLFFPVFFFLFLSVWEGIRLWM